MGDQNNNNMLIDKNQTAFEEAYRQHTGNFRTWLVAFGVGVPVFLVSNAEIWHKLEASGIKCILIPIIIGIALQVTLALVDKYADWLCLSAIYELRDQESPTVKFGVWWQKHDWLSFRRLHDNLSIWLGGLPYPACFIPMIPYYWLNAFSILFVAIQMIKMSCEVI